MGRKKQTAQNDGEVWHREGDRYWPKQRTNTATKMQQDKKMKKFQHL
jgi:hypothetical protein